MLERKERGGEAAGPAVRGLPAVRSTLQQCGLLQDLIDISLSNLRGLRTKCAASNDLTQQEIRTLEVRSRGSPAAGMRRSWGRALPPAPGAALPHRCPGRWGGENPFLSPRAQRGAGGRGREAGRGISHLPTQAAGPRRPATVPSGRWHRGIPPAERVGGARGEGRRAGAGQVREPRAGRYVPPPLRAAAARLPACGGLGVWGGRCGARRGPEVLSDCLAELRRSIPCPRMLDAQMFHVGLCCLFLVAPVLSFQACLSIPGSVSLI